MFNNEDADGTNSLKSFKDKKSFGKNLSFNVLIHLIEK